MYLPGARKRVCRGVEARALSPRPEEGQGMARPLGSRGGEGREHFLFPRESNRSAPPSPSYISR